MSKINLILPLLLVFCLSQAQTKYSKEVEERISRVEKSLTSWVQVKSDSCWTLEERMKAYNMKGVSIAVVNNFKIEWAKAYGWADIEEKKPLTTENLFQAGSMSKSLNATVILKLYQDKKVDIYKDINSYLTSFKFQYDTISGGKFITLANLLSHTSGLTDDCCPGYIKGSEIPNAVQVIKGENPTITKPVRAMYPPGSTYEYSGGGTTVSQVVVSDVTKQSYDKYIKSIVLNPMGMINTSFTQPPSLEMQKKIATAYTEEGTPVVGKYRVYPELAAAGMWSTPTDLCKYIIETQLSYSGKSNKILSQKSTQLRFKPVMSNLEPDVDAVMGGFILRGKDETYFFHGGGTEGYTSIYFGSLKSGQGVVVMTNTADRVPFIKEVVNSVAKVYGWKDYPLLPVEKNVVVVSDTVLSKYVGKYDTDGEIRTITKKGSRLYVDDDEDLCEMQFTSPTEFFLFERWGGNYAFKLDDKGKVNSLTISRKGNMSFGKKIE